MFKKILIFALLSIILSSCGYVSIYKGAGEFNYRILVTEISGDRDMGILINTKLKRYSKIKSDKKFEVAVNTKYQKNIIAKDTAGKASDYQIKVESTFNVKSEKLNKKIKITETFNVKSLDDKFEEQRYDAIIKDNIANKIIKKLTLQLSRN